MAASKSVAIVGGGISGLAAAFRLARRTSPTSYKVTIFESTDRAGGWIQSTVTDEGNVLEGGPRSVRPAGLSGRAALNLVYELGLQNSIIAVNSKHQAVSNRYIYVYNKLHKLPSGLMSMLKPISPFSKSLMYMILRDWWMHYGTKPSLKDSDESVYQFFQRRFSTEMADFLADPFCRGTSAGDARKLSMKACFPQVVNYEEQYGSILAGALLDKAIPISEADCPLVYQAKKERWRMWTLQNGMETLVNELFKQLTKCGVNIQLNTKCQQMSFLSDGKVMINSSEGLQDFDHVICALPAKNLGAILSSQHPTLSSKLSKIESITVAVVNLIYDEAIPAVNGFGHLVPSIESPGILGIIYDSCGFPQLDSKTKSSTRFSVLMGGAWFSQIHKENATDDYYIQMAVNAVRNQLGVKLEPSTVKLSMQRDCIPQYTIGHLPLVRQIFDYIAMHSLPMSLVGASYQGIGLADCIRNANLAADRI
ncbi:uncharacterized protein TRIADDRAFT_31028 [Trichoplax adhaerens]|uniref:Protoporphyrinogen oxidase n=1 Tax=Trichoplax adhaerens TaxID=10228 RepID=B3S8P8_TRIAD|nr:hypothetical protein TRIADDRAFT_31028 [Trichoplax adhaerens]EDV20923.1 hypothetical protein TRIADDRAFT_31028 [Trichoplax adhaerens]|eukprot:XP_002116567.1 hypothetical protein TRIADDRAFT_31028 [Trichoplax adhaerens]